MVNRRDFLKASIGAAAGGAAFFAAQRKAYAQFVFFPPSPRMQPFVDPLPIPRVQQPTGYTTIQGKAVAQYQVPMRAAMQKLHRDLPPTPIWGYWGSYPGPSFEVRRGQPITVRYLNELPEKHLFSAMIDPTLHGAEPGTPEVRTVVHLHGARVMPESDGLPEQWFTRGFAQKGADWSTENFYYPNEQAPAMLWYHDHTIAITRFNVLAGLAGLYFLRENDEDSLNLPSGRYEIPLVIQDRRFNQDGSIYYPPSGLVPDVHPLWQPEYLGDIGVVNGVVNPFLQVEARKYRFRILNACNTQFVHIRLQADGQLIPFHQIGADLGFMPSPVTMESLLLSPAERVDVIVDFAGHAGKEIIMTNDAAAFFPIGPPPPVFGPPQLMMFRVQAASGSDNSRIPASLPAEAPLREQDSVMTRDIVSSEEVAIVGNIPLPTVLLLENLPFEAPAINKPRAGTTEIWRHVNATFVAHPQHIHLAHEQVLDRQPFDLNQYLATGNIVFTGPAVPPDLNEVNAPKDTIRVDLGTVTRVLVKFEMPAEADLTPGKTFKYVHHCHMLEHEDNDMMRPFEIVAGAGSAPVAAIMPATLATTQREIELDGSTSTGEGLTYAWKSTGPRQASILPRELNTPKVTVQFVSGRGDYGFELQVTDAGGRSSTANASINYQGL